METVFLIVVSFVASTLTATVGLGGGILLISVMPGLIPAAAIVPVHGAVQLASNSSRVLMGVRHIDWRVVWPFVGGSIVGAAAGVGMVARFSFEQLPLYLGLFVLVVTWVPIPSRLMAFPGQFAVLGAIQTYISLFMGATGPLASPFLLRRGLSKDQLVVTLGTVMMAIHVFKLLVFAVAGVRVRAVPFVGCGHGDGGRPGFLGRHEAAGTPSRTRASSDVEGSDHRPRGPHDRR